MLRLTPRFWVDAYLTRLRVADIQAYVVAHGDDTGGAILIKLNTLDGQAALYQRSYDMTSDQRRWAILDQGPEADMDASIARQRGYDPDLWVIEVEDRQGRHMLDAEP